MSVHATCSSGEEFPLRAALHSFQEVLGQRKFYIRGKKKKVPRL